MNEIQERAIQNAIGSAEDNLARAKMQKRANPNWRGGNDESIDDVIADYKHELAELKEGGRGEMSLQDDEALRQGQSPGTS